MQVRLEPSLGRHSHRLNREWIMKINRVSQALRNFI